MSRTEVAVSFRTLRFAFLVTFLVLLGLAPVARAQSMTSTDVQRLQDAVNDASRDITALRGTNANLAEDLDRELEKMRDETIYLKVKLGRNESVPRADYFELRDKIDALRSRARTEGTSTSTSTSTPAPVHDIPSGTELDVRLTRGLSSATASVEDKVEATTLVDLQTGSKVTIPAGSTLRGVVSSVTKAGRLERKGSLVVTFDELSIGRKSYPIQATVVQALESEGIKGEVGKIGTAGAVGAIIGGILGGFKGAMAGVLIGGGGMIAATDGKDVELPVGSVLRVKIDPGLDLD